MPKKKPAEDLTHQFYQAVLVAFEVGMKQDIDAGTPQGDLLTAVSAALKVYEDQHWPMDQKEFEVPAENKEKLRYVDGIGMVGE